MNFKKSFTYYEVSDLREIDITTVGNSSCGEKCRAQITVRARKYEEFKDLIMRAFNEIQVIEQEIEKFYGV